MYCSCPLSPFYSGVPASQQPTYSKHFSISSTPKASWRFPKFAAFSWKPEDRESKSRPHVPTVKVQITSAVALQTNANKHQTEDKQPQQYRNTQKYGTTGVWCGKPSLEVCSKKGVCSSSWNVTLPCPLQKAKIQPTKPNKIKKRRKYQTRMRWLPGEISVGLEGKKGFSSQDSLAHLSMINCKDIPKHKMCKLVCLLGSEVRESKKWCYLA